MAFLVILLSPWSPRCPHVIPVIPTSSLCCPCHPHFVPIAPRRSPCGPHGCGLRGLLCCLRGLHPMLSVWSPCRPHGSHIIPMLSPSSPHYPHSPQKVPMWSPWLWSLWSPLLSPWFRPYVVPVVPTSSPSSPHRPRVIPVLSPSSPRHLEGHHIIPNCSDTHLTHPPPPRGIGGPKSVKMQ